MSDIIDELLTTSSRSVEAPAGCGKTELIADTIARLDGRALVLTHTHAGVRSIRDRMARKGVERSRANVQTIASWCLDLASAFPVLAGYAASDSGDVDYEAAYAGCARLLKARAIAAALAETYAICLVDEYQDCTEEQHAVVQAIAGAIRCHVLGDPLQAIFGFGDNRLYPWRLALLEFLPIPLQPVAHRWAKHNRELGQWLLDIRPTLQAGGRVPVAGAPLTIVPTNAQDVSRFCRDAGDRGGTVLAVSGSANEAYHLVRRLSSRYSCIEEIECRTLMGFAGSLDSVQPSDRSGVVLDFVQECSTGLGDAKGKLSKRLRSPTRRFKALEPGLDLCLAALKGLAPDSGSESYLLALDLLAKLRDVKIVSRELWFEARRMFAAHVASETLTYREAARLVRAQTARLGRVAERLSVGRTLLVKGLEYDRVVVVRPEAMDRQNLYVALTRARTELAIVSDAMHL